MPQIGKYEILEELGRGGFAVVYKARDARLNRTVALKVLKGEYASEIAMTTRFMEAARKNASLVHRNIVYVYEVDEDQGVPYIAMEHLPGGSLYDRLRGEPLPIDTAITIVLQVAAALDYAHQRNIVHRDVAPSNILFDDEGRAVLADFLLVMSLTSTSLTDVGTVLGTPNYMSPEQIDPNAEIDLHADVYSLGIVAYEMLTGRVPFDADLSLAVLYAHVHQPPPNPSTLNPVLDDAITTVLFKALAKSPDERYASAGEFAHALHIAWARKKAIGQSVTTLESLYTQAQEAMKAGQWNELVSLCLEIRSLDPDHSEASALLTLGTNKLAEEGKQRQQQRKRDQQYEVIQNLLTEQKYLEAIEALASLVKQFPNFLEAKKSLEVARQHNGLYQDALRKQNIGDYREAYIDLLSLLKLVPDYTEARWTLVNVLIQIESQASGSTQQQKSQTLDQLLLNAAEAISEQGKLKVAAELWEFAAEIFESEGRKIRASACRCEAAKCLELPIITLDIEYEYLVLSRWTRFRFIVGNAGFGPAHNLVIHISGKEFHGEVIQTRPLVTLGIGAKKVESMDVKPLASGDKVPMRVQIEYIDQVGKVYSQEQTIYLFVAHTSDDTQKQLQRSSVFSYPTELPQTQHIDQYEIMEELGRGGFATVYKARHIELNRIVALKVLHSRLCENSEFLDRFREEARLLVTLDHPNIVRVHETGEYHGQYYLVMDLLSGYTLDKVLKESPLSPERAGFVVEQIASALDAIHQKGIVHRDIKPSNIMVNDTGKVTLFDFGITQAIQNEAEIMPQKDALGTITYMAPEVVSPQMWGPVTPSTDVYALGVTAYEMLVGRPPFKGDTIATVYSHAYSEPPSPLEFAPELDANIGKILLRALAKSPSERYSTAGEFARELGQALKRTSQLNQSLERRWYLSAKVQPIFSNSISLTLTLSKEYSGLQAIPIEMTQGEVYVLIQAEELRILEGENVIALSLPDSEVGSSDVTIELHAKDPGKKNIVIEAFCDSLRFPSLCISANIPSEMTTGKLKLPTPLGPHPIPNPDLALRIYATPQDTETSRLRFDYVLYSPHHKLHMPGIMAESVEVTTAQLARTHAQSGKILQQAMTGHSREIQEGLAVIGRELYTLLFSFGDNGLNRYYQELTEHFKSWLILSDANPWIPWELVKPHGPGWEHDFLGARYALGRWIEGWGALCQPEFPLGQVCFAQDTAMEQSTEAWMHLLTSDEAPRLDSIAPGEGLLVDWPGGYPAALDYASPVWGLHFAGYPNRLSRSLKALAVRDESWLSTETLKDHWLDLHHKAPLVTFGMQSLNGQTALTDVESKWMPTFIRAGASAFVSALWATSPQADWLFWRAFYQSIWQRVPLGEAVLQARQYVRQAMPDSMDWLAYFLVGDPMARGYIPRPGEGYTALECINHDLEQPLCLSQRYRFRASLRTAPPPWYRGRRYQATEEAWESPQVFVFAHTFEIHPGTSLPLRAPVGDIMDTTFDLVPQVAGEHDVFVKFMDGDEVRQTLSLSVTVATEEAA